ncbi:hypothetical protein RA280_27940 [Cupriavidus sp. CV2]|uniref:hypothetical protein n=1 Tax=Cupriavidus ulmosensis TaxID=3065913 RepID=UPI00296AAD0E|nr:hypothetical protein [Cupriavidus sp. CV2]MDW3685505.1 hypothetical protein [Cupriavidus sp. CV2]
MLRDSAGSDQICLCGMLSAELALLPKSAHAALQGYYKLNEAAHDSRQLHQSWGSRDRRDP